MAEGRIFAWYSGTKHVAADAEGRDDWELNDNVISLTDEVCIDVPPKWSKTSEYCASLGHKANHSAQHNAEYTLAFHPRFGDIKALRAMRGIRKGEEVFVDYGYFDEAPDWWVRPLVGKEAV